MFRSVTVRPGRPEDAPAVQQVARAAWHATYDDLLGREAVEQRVASWFDPDRLVDDDVRPDERPFLVAADDGVVGFVEAAPRDGAYHLYRLYVHPDRWREGIGGRLLERVEAAAHERGADRLTVSVLADNELAVVFYEESGFERIGESHDEAFDLPRYGYRKEL